MSINDTLEPQKYSLLNIIIYGSKKNFSFEPENVANWKIFVGSIRSIRVDGAWLPTPYFNNEAAKEEILFISPVYSFSRLPAVNHAALLPLSLLYALQYTLLRFLGGASPRISALTRSTWVARLRLTWSFTLGNITARRFASRRRSLVAARRWVERGTADACSTKKKGEREKERDGRCFHVLAQSYTTTSSNSSSESSSSLFRHGLGIPRQRYCRY